MQIRSLELFDVPQMLLEVWEQQFGPQMLPVQERAVRDCGLLDGRGLVVQAPTSAGKTFIGEMAAMRAAMAGRKVLYIVPTRALAEAKYRQFCTLYGQLGLDIVISTRDHRWADHRFRSGDFQLAVAVPEKVRALWSRTPGMLRMLGVVVLDELHTLGDPQRGVCLETLMMQLRQVEGLQIIGLSAALEESSRLAEYLKTGWLEERSRPVGLRRGILVGETYHYTDYNSGETGQEQFAGCAPVEGDSYWDAVGRLALHFAQADEPTLIFVRDRLAACRLSRQLAQQLPAVEEAPLTKRLNELESTSVRRQLADMAQHRVAFHSTDLQTEDRGLVESAFSSGELQILCCTPTLALGVNLPARNVIIDPQGWRSGAGGEAVLTTICREEFENMAGRAGRLQWNEWGRAIVIADSELSREALHRRFLLAPFTPPMPPLARLEPMDAVLHLASCAGAMQGIDLQEAYRLTYTACMCGDRELPPALAEAAETCVREGLLRRMEGNGALVPTALGRVATTHGLDFATTLWFMQWVRQRSVPTTLEAALIALLSPAVRTASLPFLSCAGRGMDFCDTLSGHALAGGVAGEFLAELLNSPAHDRTEHERAAWQALALEKWIGSLETEQVEEQVRLPAARLASLGEFTGWLVQVLAEIGGECGWSQGVQQRFVEYADRLTLGVGAEGLALARLRAPGVGRDHINQLVRQGVADPAALADIAPETLKEWIGQSAAKALLEAQRRHGRRDRPLISNEPTTAVGTFWGIDTPMQRMAGKMAGNISVDDRPVLQISKNRPNSFLFYDREVPLRPAEFRLLMALAEAPRRCIGYEVLYQRIWGEDKYVEPAQIYSHRSRLVRSLGEIVPDVNPDAILVTVPKHGLMLDLAPEEVRIG